jgi:hypothetical protein
MTNKQDKPRTEILHGAERRHGCDLSSPEELVKKNESFNGDLQKSLPERNINASSGR